MGIYKHPNSPYFHYTFTVHGKRISGSTRTNNKTLAKQIAESHKIDLLRNQHDIKKSKRIALADLAEKFLSWSQSHKRSFQRDVSLVRHLLEFFGKKELADISSLDVEAYKTHRIKFVSGSTVNREVACLKRMYNLAIQWGLAHENPAKGVTFFREPKKSFRWFSEDEIEKFLIVGDERIKAIFLIGINTGMRISELLSLKWSAIDFENDYVTVSESKTDEYRKVKMNAVVINVLKRLKRRSDFIFAHRNGKPFQCISKAFKSTCRRAGIEPATPHAMRHTFASHLMKRGVDPYTIMELGGWKSLEMVMRYSHLAPDHKQMAVNKLVEIDCFQLLK